MDAIGEYLLSVTAAAVVASCIAALVENRTSAYPLIRMLCGVFVAVTVLEPVVHMRFSVEDILSLNIPVDGQYVVDDGQRSAVEAQKDIIKQHSEAYVLEKAAALGCRLEVRITLSEEPPYEPVQVYLSGAVSPYAKGHLSAWLKDAMNIPLEEQLWSG